MQTEEQLKILNRAYSRLSAHLERTKGLENIRRELTPIADDILEVIGSLNLKVR